MLLKPGYLVTQYNFTYFLSVKSINMAAQTITANGAGEIKKLRDTYFSVIPGIDNAGSVPVLDAANLEEAAFTKKWVYRNAPCLIRGAVAHWDAVEKWRRKEYWLSVCSDFDITFYPHQNFNDESLRKGIDTSFHKAIDRLFDGDEPVVSMPSEPIEKGKRLSDVLNDIGDFKFFKSAGQPRMYDRQRLFSYRCAATAWHYHNIDETLMCQVNGSKRVALLSPDIPKAAATTYFLQNELYLDGDALDTSLDLKPFIVDVNEGDALYIPPYWHHGVVPNDEKVGFTLAYCWKSPWIKFGNLGNYFVKKFYRDAIWPFKTVSLFMPFIACYSGALYLLNKLRR